jgi:ribokinase
MKVISFGSINMDLVVRAPRLPQPGETLLGSRFVAVPGGKGANQAVAAARLGVPTHMIGCVGTDAYGQPLIENLQRSGVQTAGIQAVEGSSGVALITVSEAGANTIIVVAGANEAVGEAALRALETLESGDVLLLQLEIPLPVVVQAAQMGARRGAFVILDPAPAQALPPTLYPSITMITPNQSEAEQLVGFAVNTPQDGQRAAEQLVSWGVAHAVVKMGGSGAVYASAEAPPLHLPPHEVPVVDTVAAGDAFNGGTAAGLAQGLPIAEALRWGMATGALCVTRHGAQEAMPTRDEVIALLGR